MSTITCPHCNAENAADIKICHQCGMRLQSAEVIVCPNCQTENPAAWQQCVECGTNLHQTNVTGDRPAEPEATSQKIGNQPKSDHSAIEDELVSLEGWLGELPESSVTKQVSGEEGNELPLEKAEAGDELLDWLQDLEPTGDDKAIKDQVLGLESEDSSEALPDWVTELSPKQDDLSDVDELESLADWLAEPDEVARPEHEEPSQLHQTTPLTEYHEIDGIPKQLVSDELPDWLKQESLLGDHSFEEDEAKPPVTDPLPKDVFTPTEPLPLSEKDESEPSLSPPSGEESEIHGAEVVAAAAIPTPSAEDEGDWYSKLADTDLESALDEMLGIEDETTKQLLDDDSLDFIDPSLSTDDLAPTIDPKVEGEADLGSAEIPIWLQALKPEELNDQAGKEEPVESSGVFAGLRGMIPVAAAIAEPRDVGQTAEYTMTKEQRQQVTLLKQLTTAETEDDSPIPLQPSGDTFLTLRLVIGVVLLVIVIAGWIMPPLNSFLPGLVGQPISVEAESAISVLDAAAGRPALVAFEYTPAMGGELDPIAKNFLQNIADNGGTAVTISQVAAGVPVAQNIVEEVEGLNNHAIGYLPGEAIGIRGLGSCLATNSSCETIGLKIDQETQALLKDTGVIIVLSGERDGMVSWIEQVGTQTSVPMIAGLTQALSPVAGPYLASRQLAGAVVGLPEAAAIENLSTEGDGFTTKALNSLTVAQWLAIIVLAIGAFYYGLAGFRSTIWSNKGVK